MPLNATHIEEAFSSREEGVKRLLGSILNYGVQHESNEKTIISIINKFLSTAKNRKEGLEYLGLIIDNCSASVIADNALNWINHCIVKFPDDILRELKLRLIGRIIKASYNESDFNKRFVSDYISKVLDNCITTSNVNLYECRTALKTLTIAMSCYSSWFGVHRQKIEDFILIFLDSKDPELVNAAASAFHFLQQIGSAGTNGVNHKNNFTQAFHKLCRTAHKLFDNLFENETELFHTQTEEGDTFTFQDEPTENLQALLHTNARRIHNVFKFIEVMIRTRYPVSKETKPKMLLELVSRGLSIHKCISGDNTDSLDTYQFSLLLLEIQCATLKLLRLFIIWYQSNALPFSYTLSKIIVDSLERSQNCSCFRYDSLYQEYAYRAFSEWIAISKSSFHPQFQSTLMECILKDVTPVKTQLTLTISESISGKKSQKAKRKAMANRIISSGNQTAKESYTGFEKSAERCICKFALSALRSLLESTRLNVKTSLVKDLYKSLFDSLISIQSGRPQHPYTDPQCQTKLYEILVAIYHQNTLTVLPPLQTSLDILNRGANSKNRFVANICHDGLRILESFCQPICPSLYLGGAKEEEEDFERLEPVVDVTEIEEVENEDEDEMDVDYDASTVEYPDKSGNFDNRGIPESTFNDDINDADSVVADSENSNIAEESNNVIKIEDLETDDTENRQPAEEVVKEPTDDLPGSENGDNLLEELSNAIEEEAESEENLDQVKECTSSINIVEGHTEDTANFETVGHELSLEAKPTDPEVNNSSQKEAKTNDEDLGDTFDENKETVDLEENVSVDLNDSLEPEAKRPRLEESNEGHDKSEELDDRYLEDDSFADEVKDCI